MQLSKNIQETKDNSIFLYLAFFSFIIYDQFNYWQNIPDYHFGFLMPIFALYVLYERRHSIHFRKKINPLTFSLSLIILLFASLMRASYGPLPTTSLILMIGFSLFSFSLFPIKPLLFPVLIAFISFPLIPTVEIPLKLTLLKLITYASYFIFDTAGFQISLEGNLLVLPSGTLGVNEACSGIRSLTASFFVASFLSASLLNSFRKKILLIFLSLPIAIFFNFIRTFFLTAYAFVYNVDAANGHIHDIAGYSVIILSSLSLLLLAHLLTLEIE